MMPSAAEMNPFGIGEQDFLHPDEAFVLTVIPEGPERLRAYFSIAEGYYLYREKTRFTTAGDAQIMPYHLPPGEIRNDPLFGQVQTWSGEVVADLHVVAASASSPEVSLLAQYQGCAERGVCYPPQKKTFKVAMATSVPPQPPTSGPREPVGLLSHSGQIAQDLSHETLAWSFLAFMGFGILLAFTPCILPMIPILAGVIAGAKADTRQAFFLSLTYVLAMALTYALLGVAIGLTGANFQASMQNPWVISGFVLILIALALSMFGIYEFRLPTVLHNRLHQVGQKFEGGGSYLGAGVMGLLGALVASPCVSPPLVGALIHIADTGSATRGAISLFAMGLGLGLPLLGFGAFEGRFVPHSGPWMVRVKALFGVLLLALSIWMLDRIVPGQVTLALTGFLLLMLGAALRAFDSQTPNARMPARLGKAVGLALFIYGTILLVGAVTGGDSLRRPWQQFASTLDSTELTPEFRPIKSREDLDRELVAARGRPVLLDFYADWCVTCHELDAFTFSERDVQDRMRHFVLLRADITNNDAEDKRLLDFLGLFGPPAILFYDADGAELQAFRTVSYIPAKRFANELDEILSIVRQQ